MNDSKDLINELQASTGIDELLIVKTAIRNGLRGTYVHPALITAIVNWVSPSFEAKMCTFIEEWKQLSAINTTKWWDAIATATPSSNSRLEHNIQLDLCKSLHGQMEVKTPDGFIDILTDTSLIEIKHVSHWKHALGQILAYSEFYSDKNLMIYLFGVNESNYDVDHIQTVLSKRNIMLVVYN
jgi:hypothetical protein